LVNSRTVEDILVRAEQAGASETGGAMLGKMIRLPQPLDGTKTRIVTVLSACVVDERHEARNPLSFTFDPQAMAEAAQIAEMRGFGESVLTVFHTHGWGTGCENCNQNELCVLPQCTQVSSADYQLLETLFPSKSTLMPIAGRKLGAEGRRPVLEIHAWRGGRMRPIRWQQYED
jgi:proteasome lid subunit RPN8/RPN11